MILILVLFVVTFTAVLISLQLGFSYFKSKQKQQIRSMLRNAEASPAEQRNSELLRPPQVQDYLAKLLRRFHLMDRLDLLLDQAGQKWTGSQFIIISCVAGAVGFLLGAKLGVLGHQGFSSFLLGGLAAVLPLIIVLRKRSKTLSAFEQQFPEALDFISRSMRAGHGFTIALEMLAADSPDPLGSAFQRVSNDLQLGSSLEVALNKLVTLMPLVDVRFFISSVLVQQETGGNLGEILTKLSQVIRARFRLRGQVKAVSAHGRITGLVLLLMPVGVTAALMFLNPKYLAGLIGDPVGRMMVYGAALGQVVAYFVIRKIVNIKV
jgi:tight adherence protein B